MKTLLYFQLFLASLTLSAIASKPQNPQLPLSAPDDPDHDPNPDPTDPYAGLPPLPANMVWNSFPLNPLYLSDSAWYDTLGNSQIAIRRLFASPSKSTQIASSLALLDEFPARGPDILFAAAVKGKAHVISALLQAGVAPQPTPGSADDMAQVPLQAAAFNGQLAAVRVLVEEGGVGVDAEDDVGSTALMQACGGAHPDIVAWLLERGADPRRRQEGGTGTGAAEFTAGGGCVECVRLLLERVAKEGEAGDGGVEITPLALQAGAHSRSIEMVRFLLEKGGYPVDDVDEEGIWKGERLSAEQRYNI
ncbi:ankyrin [Mytilinidion resinicola]|uniref:Ankyrin n=1 Tax=Mytilinidion resinicola TaxID=574789 RepID=A0A6A6XYI2_9PEZI|nr:ankyrin [Mytilinidion resinicola]KAF2801480.1 ankyrin [Mytilinidion resinicola]